MNKTVLSVIVVALFSGMVGCNGDDSSKSGDITQCANGRGVIVDDITQAKDDNNSTHQNGYCLADEKCVQVFNGASKTQYACSLHDEGQLNCNNDLVNALNSNDHCGKCGNKCDSDKYCNAGYCISKCGNHVLDDGEECDDSYSYTIDCGEDKTFKYKSSGCKADCTMDRDIVCRNNGPICGNGKLESGEECDGEKVDLDYTCPENKKLYYSTTDKATRCTNDCKINTEAVCRVDMCGNGVLDSGEECDGELISESYTCSDGEFLNYESADNTTRCQGCFVVKDVVCKRTCGNGKLDEGEECEGNYYDKAYNCGMGRSFNYSSADDTKRCINCKINDSIVCKEIPQSCGNGVIDGSEACDGNAVASNACGEGYRLKTTYNQEMCTELCTIKSDACISSAAECLNGYLDEGEECEKGGVVSKSACGEGMAINTTKLEDMSLCSMGCLLTDKEAMCHEENVCGDGFVDDGEWCDYTLAEDGVTKNYIYSSDLNVNCKIPEIEWPWFKENEGKYLSEAYFSRPVCKKRIRNECYFEGPVMGEYCPLKDDYLYIQGGVTECKASAELVGDEVVAQLTFSAEDKYKDAEFKAMMVCEDAISGLSLAMTVDVELKDDIKSSNKHGEMTVVKSGNNNNVSMNVASLKSEDQFFCYVLLKGQPVLFDEAKWDWDDDLNEAIPTSRSLAYLCNNTGEPRYARGDLMNIMLGKLEADQLINYKYNAKE